MNRRLFTRFHLNSIFILPDLVFFFSFLCCVLEISSKAGKSFHRLILLPTLHLHLLFLPLLVVVSRLLQLFNFFGFVSKLKFFFLHLLLSNFRLSYRLSGSQVADASPVTNAHTHIHTHTHASRRKHVQNKGSRAKGNRQKQSQKGSQSRFQLQQTKLTFMR